MSTPEEREAHAAYMRGWNRAHRKQVLEAKKRSYEKNKEKILAQMRGYRAANPEKVRAQTNARRAARREVIAAQKRAVYAKNKEKILAQNNGWRAANRPKMNALNARREATKLQATPAWANQFFIDEIYDLAQLRTKHTGIVWHVDHRVPLKSKQVSGLHVEHNLRVIPATVNISKGNRYWPDSWASV